MFSIKNQEIVDPNTGVHLAFGDHGKDKSTVWLNISRRVPSTDGLGSIDKITSITLHRDGDVINIAPVSVALPGETKPVTSPEQKPHFVPPVVHQTPVTSGTTVTPPKPVGTTPPSAAAKTTAIDVTPSKPSAPGGLPPKP